MGTVVPTCAQNNSEQKHLLTSNLVTLPIKSYPKEFGQQHLSEIMKHHAI